MHSKGSAPVLASFDFFIWLWKVLHVNDRNIFSRLPINRIRFDEAEKISTYQILNNNDCYIAGQWQCQPQESTVIHGMYTDVDCQRFVSRQALAYFFQRM